MDLRERILTAAVSVYAETGFRGATTRRIAERAGVNEITLFRHFGSKTHLLHEAIKCSGLGVASCALPDTPGDPSNELLSWARDTFTVLHDRRSLIRTALGEMEERPDLIPPDRSPTLCAGRALHAYLQQLRADGRIDPAVDPRAAAMLLMGALFGDALVGELVPEGIEPDVDTRIGQYVTLFVRGLGLKESAA